MTLLASPPPAAPRFQTGDWVEVRPYHEIAATLGADGKLDGLPFMPEMLAYCGRRLRVFRRAEKACAIEGQTAIRRMRAAVHLEHARCDGAAHGDCQSECLLFWKEAWLRPADGPGRGTDGPPPSDHPELVTSLTGPDGQTVHVCQATELWGATCHLPWYDATQYKRDVRSKNFDWRAVVSGFVASFHGRIEKLRRRRYGRSGRTPTERLGLRVGDVVEVKPRSEIDATLDKSAHNRGLWWDPEMYQHCGKRFRVQRSLERVIDEGTGQMRTLREPTVVLEGVVCSGVYHRFCSRSSYVYWREIWLRRVEPVAIETERTLPMEAASHRVIETQQPC